MNFKKFTKIALISFAGATALFYSLIYGFDVEKKVVFDPVEGYKPAEAFLDKKVEVNQFKNKDGLAITYWYIKGDNSKPAILYCHGNAENLSYFQDKIKFLVDNKYRVFMIDYRGYGSSEGKPSEKGTYTDLESMIDVIQNKYAIKKDNLIVWGHSLGGAIVTDVAARAKFKAVILEGTFTNIKEIKTYAAKFKSKSKTQEILNRFLYAIMPLTQKFDSIHKIANIQSPLFIIHSMKDEKIPSWMGEKLAKTNQHSIFYLSKTGGHDDPYWSNNAVLDYIKNLK